MSGRKQVGLTLFLALIGVALSACSPRGPVVYEANLETLGLDSGGSLRLDNVPMKKGESYSIYLVSETGYCFPGCGSSSSRKEGEGINMFDRDGDRIQNEMRRFGAYGTPSEYGYLIGVFTAHRDGPEPLMIRFDGIIAKGSSGGGPGGARSYTVTLSDIDNPDEWKVVIRQ